MTRPRPRYLVVAVIIVFFALAAFTFLILPPLIVNGRGLTAAARLKAENDIRGTGVQLLGGLALGLGAVFTAITLIYNREQQITERFTRAVDQLGHASSDVRIGGIYALERIMKDSQRDHGPIVEVLTAFVREHAAVPELLPARYERPGGDVQAALTVLKRRPERPAHEVDCLRLSDTILRRAMLRDARFGNARFRNSHLEGAHLEHAILAAGHLRDAHLQDADLENADLTGASLPNAHLDRANLIGAKLDHAILKGASLRDAHLARATGESALTPEQLGQAHCRPKDHACSREKLTTVRDPQRS